MIIDLILDRKDGKKYSPKEFYTNIMNYYSAFPELVEPIASALDSGTEENVKRELCKYIIEQEYNGDIWRYILSVNWLTEK